MSIVTASGRRGKEVAELRGQDLNWDERTKNFWVRLPFSKTSACPTVFTFDFFEVEEWLGEVLDLRAATDNLIQISTSKGSIFRKNLHKNFSRHLEGFNLHGLQGGLHALVIYQEDVSILFFEYPVRQGADLPLCSFRAVHMLISGKSEENILSNLGWSDPKSLLRYVRVGLEKASGFESVDEALKVMQALEL